MPSHTNSRDVWARGIALLQAAGRHSKRVQLVLVGGGGLVVGVGEFGVNIVTERFQPWFGGFWVLGLLMIFAGLYLQQSVDQTTPELLADAQSATRQVESLSSAAEQNKLLVEALIDEIGFATALYQLHRSLSEALDPILSSEKSASELLNSSLQRMLDLVAEQRGRLFGIQTDERWNLSIYLWDSDAQELICRAVRR